MNAIHFDWDETKNKKNQHKHNVSFEEAKTVFYDENAIEYFDPDHSDYEDRFLLLGLSFKLSVLIVCHCFRKNENEIRIISARKATKKEATIYVGSLP